MLMQMVPVSAIGQALGSNVWTEELPHNSEIPTKADAFNFNHPFLPPANYTSVNLVYTESQALAYIHISEQTPSNHSTEVFTPPPDFI